MDRARDLTPPEKCIKYYIMIINIDMIVYYSGNIRISQTAGEPG